MGSVKYKNLNKTARDIWLWCESRNIYVFASYINTLKNSRADLLSRTKFENTEFELNSKFYQKIKDSYGEPSIDLFASNINKKCEKYVSWYPNPHCIAVDAFTIEWKEYYFYAFPPFSLIGRTLQKIQKEEATGILVVPFWPSQPWYPTFIELLIEKPIIFKPCKNLLISPFRDPHPLYKSLSLVAGKLSGRP